MSAPVRYSAEVRRLFAAPAHAGTLADDTGGWPAGEAVALDRGGWVRFQARVEDGWLRTLRFRAWGCPHLIAACERAAAALEGKRLADTAGVTAQRLASELAVPADKLGRLLLIEDALQRLAAAAAAAQ